MLIPRCYLCNLDPGSYDEARTFNFNFSEGEMADSLQKWVGRNRPPRVQITYDVEVGGAV